MRNGRTVWARKGEIDPDLLSSFLIGAEEEGEGDSGEGGSSSGESAGQGTGSAEEVAEGDSGSTSGDGDEGDLDKDTFSRDYVEKLRREAAENRVKAKEAEKELAEKKKAEMSELERAKAEAEEAIAERDAAASELRRVRLESAVTAAAQAANFHDPEDALSLLDESDISVNDEGIPNKQSVSAAIERLAKNKPHLVKASSPGSGDGGARGQGAGNIQEEEQQKNLDNQYRQKGGVPLPEGV